MSLLQNYNGLRHTVQKLLPKGSNHKVLEYHTPQSIANTSSRDDCAKAGFATQTQSGSFHPAVNVRETRKTRQMSWKRRGDEEEKKRWPGYIS
ncbi:hypothetical protein PoB_006601700 [Plakobranchus ocellatus]|uniref:Uncharacterized protein n=1 Tax=Plakobranchus ocellatus TaxID=259542 RepID=A0AAV4D5N8_9GAST|nr:hypothetical protein PoB_006601700 [Plakobranchus ocellatus]